MSSDWVLGGSGGVAASGWDAPDQDARFGLFEMPAFGLFGAVVAAAQRGQIAFARQSAPIPGDRVVQVTAGGGASTAGRSAGGAACAD
jgi:hypothetical protein